MTCSAALKVVTLTAFALFAGCTGQQRVYDGPDLPPERVAVIRGSTGLFPGTTTLSIMYVDDRQLSPYAERVEVLPGKHIIGIYYHWHLAGGRIARGEAAVEAQAGKSYSLNSTVGESGQFVSFFITEDQEGAKK